MSKAEAIGRTTGIGRLVARDASLLPAIIVAGAATVFTVISPPTWLARLPRAVVDVATGQRQELQQQLATASAQAEQATKQLGRHRRS